MNERRIIEDIVPENLLDLYEKMIGDVDIRDVMIHVAEVVRNDLNAEACSVYLVIEDTQELESVAVTGNVHRIIRLPMREDSLAGYCALSRTPFVIEDAYGDLSGISPTLRFDSSWDHLASFKTRDVMCAPATYGDRVSVVQVINSKTGTFSGADLARLRVVSRLVAYALHHACMYDELATMKALEKQKAQFMRVLVHELKSPVATSRMIASTLAFTNKGNSLIVAAAAKIGNRLDQLLSIIDDVLHLAQVKSGVPLSEIGVFDMNPAIRAVCDQYADQARGKGLILDLLLPGEPLPVRFDRRGFDLVVSNVVANAVKYTPCGWVRVRTEKQNCQAVLRVSDSGLGIPERDIPSLFKEFFRASNVRGGKIKGSGVGLAGVKQLVERFNGVLEVESRESHGTTFTVRIPLSAEMKDEVPPTTL